MTQTPSPQEWSVRKFILIGISTLLILLTGVVGWVAGARITGAVVANGQLLKASPQHAVQHAIGGVVTNVAVREGQSVQAGDILLDLDTHAPVSDLEIIEARYFEVSARKARLVAHTTGADRVVFAPPLIQHANAHRATLASMLGQQKLFDVTARLLITEQQSRSRQLAQINNNIQGTTVQITALEIQISLTGEQLDDQETLLLRGLAQARDIAGLKRTIADLQGRIGALISKRASAHERKAQIDLQFVQDDAARTERWINMLGDLDLQQSELAKRRRRARKAIADLVIRAPVSGDTLNISQITPGSVIQPAQILLHIVPQDRNYVVKVRVAPRHIDQIYLGQKTRLKFATLDPQTAPNLIGQVAVVSAGVLRDEFSNAPYYVAEIALPTSASELLASRSDINVGIPVAAFFRTADQSVWAYLTKPLMIYFSRALRES